LTTQTTQAAPRRPAAVTLAAATILVLTLGVVLLGKLGIWFVFASDLIRSVAVSGEGGRLGLFLAQLPWLTAVVLFVVFAVGVLRGRPGARIGVWVLSGLVVALMVAQLVVVGPLALRAVAVELPLALPPSLLLATPSANDFFRRP
jgi:hypothetical protein